MHPELRTAFVVGTGSIHSRAWDDTRSSKERIARGDLHPNTDWLLLALVVQLQRLET